ncbi:hypothetical protein LRY58_01800 [Candidatus Woesebacteria bacterium]|nr:hypothetical protein [Candidatus Woesebacteria bacterium]MCD8546676.1 hypothetical protein [Candidatus Woesebacteria bacterium]
MPVTTASVVGIPSKTTWSTTATLRLQSAELWCACGFSGSDDSPYEGRHFIDFLETLSAANAQEFYQQVSEYLQRVGEKTAFSVALAYRTPQSVLLITFGFGMIAFHRPAGKEVRWLMDGTQENHILEGFLQPGDTLFLGTARFKDTAFPVEKFIQLTLDDFTAEVFPRVQKHANSGEIAALVVREKGQPTPAAAAPAAPVAPQKLATAAPSKQTESSEPTVPSSGVSPSLAAHLISPEKIRAGVEAAHVQDVTSKNVRHRLPTQWLQRVQDFNWRQLHLVRIAAVIGVVVVLVGGLIWYRSWNVTKEYTEVVVPLEQLVSDLQAENDRFAQRNEAEALLERIQATRVSYNANRRRVLELESSAESVFNQVSGQREIVNLPVFYDFRLISPDFLASEVAREGDTAFFLDGNKKQAISLNVTNKQNESIPIDTQDELRDMTIIGSRLFFLTNSGVLSSTLSGADLQTAVGFDDDVEDPSYLSSFGENVYVLDRGAQQIWRADALAEDASPSGWVRSAAGVDFSNISSMAINGSIWLGSNSGEVYQLLAGQRESYDFIGLPEPFTSSLLVAANEEGEKLVVVEPAQKRLVVFQKETGEYLQQITSEQIGAVTDVVLDEEERVAYLLAGSVVYRVEVE